MMIILDQKKQAVAVNSRVHLEMDEVEELLELARKTNPRSWCVLTLAFNHGLRVSECAGGAPAIPGKNRPAIPPLTLSDIDMKHRTIRVRRLKGSLETTQAFVEHRGKPALSTRISWLTRSGRVTANVQATAPPSEWPATAKRSPRRPRIYGRSCGGS